MSIGLVYLGVILLIGGCFLYVRYNLKNINLRITTLMELCTALTTELELIQKNIGIANNNNMTSSISNNIDSISNLIEDDREVISDDEDDDEDDDDDDDDEDDDDEDEIEIDKYVVKDSIVDNNNNNIEILELDTVTDYDKLTVPELKKIVKDRNPEISITKLKKDELISLLIND